MKNKGSIPRKGINPALANMTTYQRDAMLIRASTKANKVVTLMVLADYFNFSRDDMIRFMEEFDKQIRAYHEGYIEKVSDFEGVLEEEFEIKVEL